MDQRVRVDSIDALKDFRGSLVRFAESARSALQNFDSGVRRTFLWLTDEQTVYWSRQIKKRAEKVQQAKIALNQKKLFKTHRDIRRSCVEEEKALRLAKARHEEAREKLRNVKRWIRELDRNIPIYKGRVQKTVDSVELGIPRAIAHLDRLLDSLDHYVALKLSPADLPDIFEPEESSMARDGETDTPDGEQA